MKIISIVLILLVLAGALISAEVLVHTNFIQQSAKNVTVQAPPNLKPQQGIYIDNSTVYLVYMGEFSQVKIGNQTFIHGGPLMAGFNGIYLVENQTPINPTEIMVYNGTWYKVSLPVIDGSPGGIPKGFLYPQGSVIPL